MNGLPSTLRLGSKTTRLSKGVAHACHLRIFEVVLKAPSVSYWRKEMELDENAKDKV